MRPPAVIVVGAAAASALDGSWFTRRALFGIRILVTRPHQQAEDLGGPLRELGAEVFYQPAIEIAEPIDWAPVDSAIRRLEQFDWVAFSSANGVRFFLERLYASGCDMRRLAAVGIAAIGPGTADALAQFGLRADRVPEQFQAEALAASLREFAQGKRFLLIRASRGREVLAAQLQAAGGQVEQVVAYASRDVAQARPWVVEALDRGRIDWITVTSSAIARSLVHLFGDRLRQSRLVSISPLTSEVLRGLGYAPAAEAAQATMAGVVGAIRRACGEG
jgi:uroporphyrinogen III methyltransferase/synthase